MATISTNSIRTKALLAKKPNEPKEGVEFFGNSPSDRQIYIKTKNPELEPALKQLAKLCFDCYLFGVDLYSLKHGDKFYGKELDEFRMKTLDKNKKVQASWSDAEAILSKMPATEKAELLVLLKNSKLVVDPKEEAQKQAMAANKGKRIAKTTARSSSTFNSLIFNHLFQKTTKPDSTPAR